MEVGRLEEEGRGLIALGEGAQPLQHVDERRHVLARLVDGLQSEQRGPGVLGDEQRAPQQLLGTRGVAQTLVGELARAHQHPRRLGARRLARTALVETDELLDPARLLKRGLNLGEGPLGDDTLGGSAEVRRIHEEKPREKEGAEERHSIVRSPPSQSRKSRQLWRFTGFLARP
ncbi:hypothetical protein ACN28S_35315 [Cystobacter fuscus]